MRVDHIEIKNFRCFRDISVEFDKRFNLIVGDNGSGKTAFLEALAIASGSWLLGVRGFDKRHIKGDDITVTYMSKNGNIWREEAEVTEVSADGEVLGEKMSWKRALRGRTGRTTTKDAKNITDRAVAASVAVRMGAEIDLPLISYYGTGRLWQIPNEVKQKNGNKKEFLSRFQGYKNSVDPRCSPVEFMRWLDRQARIAIQEGRESGISSEVKNAVMSCIEGGMKLWYSHKYEEVLIEIAGQGVQPFANLSDGQRNMVAMVGDIAIKAAQLNPQLGENAVRETPGIVLIDELDLHLHPKWQRRVVSDLKRTFPNIQFFCTTHSPQIIGETPKQEIIKLTHDGYENPVISYGSDSNWILKHVMGASERSEPPTILMKQIEQAGEQKKFDLAKRKLKKLREMVGEMDGGMIRLDQTIRSLEALADEED